MSEKKIATPADVAQAAAKDGLVVPSQSNPETTVEITEDGVRLTEVDVDVTTDENGKPLLRARLASLGNLVREHKKGVLITLGTVAGVTAVAFLKFAKKQAEAALVEDEVLEPVDVEDNEPISDEV